MKSFSELIPDVLQGLFNEGVEESSFNKNRAEYAIRRSYRDFLKKTHMFKRTWVQDGQAHVGEYDLFEFDNELLVKIYNVTVDGVCYTPAKKICSCNCCKNTYHYDGSMLHICPAPECDGVDIEACVTVMPPADVCEMDDRIYQMYGEAIVSGAIHLLLSKKISAPYQVEYDSGVTSGTREAARQWSTGRNAGNNTKYVRR